jgi:hypothetical protein
VGRRLTLIVLFGAAAIAAVWYAPSWVDQRQNPQVVLSAHVVNLGRVPVNTRVEHLLTIRNSGHTSITAKDGGGRSGSRRRSSRRFDYVATSQDWRRAETCLTVTGNGVRGGKSRPAR